MANTCTLVQVDSHRDSAIVDLASSAGYRAKEMPSLCSHFVLGHQSETLGEKRLEVFVARWGASPAVINNFALTVARVTCTNRFGSHFALGGVER